MSKKEDISNLLFNKVILIAQSYQYIYTLYNNEAEYEKFLDSIIRLLDIEPDFLYLNENIYPKLSQIVSYKRFDFQSKNIITKTNEIIIKTNRIMSIGKNQIKDKKISYIRKQCAARCGAALLMNHEVYHDYDECNSNCEESLIYLIDFDFTFFVKLISGDLSSINNNNVCYYISSLYYLLNCFPELLNDSNYSIVIKTLVDRLHYILEESILNNKNKVSLLSSIEVMVNIDGQLYTIQTKTKELK